MCCAVLCRAVLCNQQMPVTGLVNSQIPEGVHRSKGAHAKNKYQVPATKSLAQSGVSCPVVSSQVEHTPIFQDIQDNGLGKLSAFTLIFCIPRLYENTSKVRGTRKVKVRTDIRPSSRQHERGGSRGGMKSRLAFRVAHGHHAMLMPLVQHDRAKG